MATKSREFPPRLTKPPGWSSSVSAAVMRSITIVSTQPWLPFACRTSCAAGAWSGSSHPATGAIPHGLLKIEGTAYGVDCAAELNESAVAGVFDNSAAMFTHRRLHDLAPAAQKPRVRP